MEVPPSHDVTGLLQAWGQGDEEALQKLADDGGLLNLILA